MAPLLLLLLLLLPPSPGARVAEVVGGMAAMGCVRCQMSDILAACQVSGHHRHRAQFMCTNSFRLHGLFGPFVRAVKEEEPGFKKAASKLETCLKSYTLPGVFILRNPCVGSSPAVVANKGVSFLFCRSPCRMPPPAACLVLLSLL